MSDYCRDCWEELFGDGYENDLKGLCEPGEKIGVLCEGCGFIYVDHNGNRVEQNDSNTQT